MKHYHLSIFSLLLAFGAPPVFGQQGKVHIPRRQSAPPGPPLSAEEAAKKFTVPEGFAVQVVAAEPDVVNPVAMAIDEKGRFWVTESFSYPKKDTGAGLDRIKVLEDTDGDGVVDKTTIFAEGLNIPSGIAVGYGGVWVCNSPDLLFLQDTDGDLKADTQKVIATGFGRTDTHELPNALTWGPDGWLYGLNGVFNYSNVTHRGKTIPFTCAVFRVNPRAETEGEWAGTHDFELFAEGTSNPWGIAFDENGELFLSACVIDHLWHISESGYYHRQGGPYPPHTWKLESIVKHKHQMAAYCGITWFDSPTYPEEYSGHLYMGNIHGGCVNVDSLERSGSSYFGKPRPDFMTANDVWHMPVAQEVGPDGCLYVLDWYDRYHCYQDANADPEGVDRGRGRLYRVTYGENPRAAGIFDLAMAGDESLVEMLEDPNIFFRNTAQRLLQEAGKSDQEFTLREIVEDKTAPKKTRLHALWSLMGNGEPLDPFFHRMLLYETEPQLRAWGVRAAGNQDKVSKEIRNRIAEMTRDESPDVVRQVVIAARKIEGLKSESILADALANCLDDETIPHLVWQNLKVDGITSPDVLMSRFQKETNPDSSPGITKMASQLGAFWLGGEKPDLFAASELLTMLIAAEDTDGANALLREMGGKIRTGEIDKAQLVDLRGILQPALDPLLEPGNPLQYSASLVAIGWRNPAAYEFIESALQNPKWGWHGRIHSMEAFIAIGESETVTAEAKKILGNGKANSEFKRGVLSTLGKLGDPSVADVVLETLGNQSPALRRDAIELLASRPDWAAKLVTAVKNGTVKKAEINPLQATKLGSANPKLKPAIKEIWGAIRTERNPQREKVIAKTKMLVKSKTGDWKNGQQVFARACAACHKMHGKGNLIGPDITTSGRGTLDQLLSNVLDPNLVIGEDYQARIVKTKDGRSIMGLPVEDNAQRVIIRPPTGKDDTIPRNQIDSIEVLPISLMPEGLENTMTEQELVDLINFLAHDKHPSNPEAAVLSGVKLK